MDVTDSISAIKSFRSTSLKHTLHSLENSFSSIPAMEVGSEIDSRGININLLAAAFTIKKAAGQINVIIHSLGILLSLPHILQPDEMVDALSLGAGNTGKDFDLVTNTRIAEFKFIQWQGGPESIRQNSVFKDFFYLAEEDTPKSRFLYLLERERPIRFFEGNRKLSSVLSRNECLRDDFRSQYGDRFRVVKEYFEYRRSLVEIIDLRDLVPSLLEILNNLQAP